MDHSGFPPSRAKLPFPIRIPKLNYNWYKDPSAYTTPDF